jgi:hypothetical protein
MLHELNKQELLNGVDDIGLDELVALLKEIAERLSKLRFDPARVADNPKELALTLYTCRKCAALASNLAASRADRMIEQPR